MKHLLISACLLGLPCRYDGQCRPLPALDTLLASFSLVPVCPEQLGGLPTPRAPAERAGVRVVTQGGQDVTDAYLYGAEQALYLAQLFGCSAALLKARSPSCGSGQIHDGTLQGGLTAGDGVTAALLKQNGIRVYTELELDVLLRAEAGSTP